MDFETLLTEQRWNILRQLSEKPASPLQLSGALHTSMANISQQLRLLEAADLVKKEKQPNRDRGKPRTMYSLSGSRGYVVSIAEGFARKELILLSLGQLIMLKTWFVKDKGLLSPLQAAVLGLEPHLDLVRGLFMNEQEGLLIILIEAEESRKSLLDALPVHKKLRIVVILAQEAAKLMSQERKPFGAFTLLVLHDPLRHLSGSRLQGGMVLKE